MVILKINGQSREVKGPREMPLLWALREELSLTGTKFGCGIAACGACTVHVNGEAVKSCIRGIGTLEGQEVRTIEGLPTSGPDALHPVQQAWLDENVSQCGYCQPGQIMAAAALLSKKSDPSDAEIDEAMSSNLCRCGTYPRIRKAVKRAAQLMKGTRS